MGQTLGWIAYAAALPGLFSLVGLPMTCLPMVLLADQLVFGLVDLFGGIGIDLIHSRVRRLALPLAFAGLLSALSFGALLVWPQSVQGSLGQAGLLGLIFAWAFLSSLLRGPTFSLIVRRERPQGRGVQLGLWTLGVAITGLLTPFWTAWVREVDPLFPILLSSLFLLISAVSLPLVAVVPSRTESNAENTENGGLFSAFAGALLLSASTYCVHLALQLTNLVVLSQKLTGLIAGDQRTLVMAVSGVGMTFAAPVVLGLNQRVRPAVLLQMGLLLGLPSLFAIGLAPSSGVLALALFAWGAAQAFALSGGASLSARIGGSRFTGAVFGAWWSAAALATTTRMVWLKWGPALAQDPKSTLVIGLLLLLLSVGLGLPLLRYSKNA